MVIHKSVRVGPTEGGKLNYNASVLNITIFLKKILTMLELKVTFRFVIKIKTFYIICFNSDLCAQDTC